MHTSHSNRCHPAIFALMMITAVPLEGQFAEEAALKVQFGVLAVRVLSDSEALVRSPDFFGQNVAVRLRLSTGSRPLWLYVLEDMLVPGGFRVQETERGVVWLFGDSGMGERVSSPGLQKALYGAVGEWILIQPFSAIEWEMLDSTTFSGKKHALSAFLKAGGRKNRERLFLSGSLCPTQSVRGNREGNRDIHDRTQRDPAGRTQRDSLGCSNRADRDGLQST